MDNGNVTVSFSITVKGAIGGSFEMPRDAYEQLRARWEARGNCHDETELAEKLLGMAPLNYFDHLMVDEMEIEDLDSKNATEPAHDR
jgi:hypothetical protein